MYSGVARFELFCSVVFMNLTHGIHESDKNYEIL
jgi:hypothetical protein